jgi:multisubunit Na+/H+ antiporter MnhB subunit
MVPELDPGLLANGVIGAIVTLVLGLVKQYIPNGRPRFFAAIGLSAAVGIGWAVISLQQAGEPITVWILVENAAQVWASSLVVFNLWRQKLGLAAK